MYKVVVLRYKPFTDANGNQWTAEALESIRRSFLKQLPVHNASNRTSSIPYENLLGMVTQINLLGDGELVIRLELFKPLPVNDPVFSLEARGEITEERVLGKDLKLTGVYVRDKSDDSVRRLENE